MVKKAFKKIKNSQNYVKSNQKPSKTLDITSQIIKNRPKMSQIN